MKDRIAKVDFAAGHDHILNSEAMVSNGPCYVNLIIPQTMGESSLSSVIDVFMGHWPEEYKTRIQSEIYDNLNQAEEEYATCKQLKEPNLPSGYVRTRLDDSALLSRLAFHVLSHARSEIDAAQIDTETAVLAEMVESVVMSKLVDGKGAPNSDLVPAMTYGTLDAFGLLVDRAGAALVDRR